MTTYILFNDSVNTDSEGINADFNDSNTLNLTKSEVSEVRKRDYIPMFSVERELNNNLNLIKNIKITSSIDYTVRASLLLKRVELLKIKDIKDSIQAIINKGVN